jgi:uncharacterized short protein YbdD (DUF466 family)
LFKVCLMDIVPNHYVWTHMREQMPDKIYAHYTTFFVT